MTRAETLAELLRQEAAARRDCIRELKTDIDVYDAAGVDELAELVKALPEDDPHLARLVNVGCLTTAGAELGWRGRHMLMNFVPDSRFAGLEFFLHELVDQVERESTMTDEARAKLQEVPITRHARCKEMASYLRIEGDSYCVMASDSADPSLAHHAALLFETANLVECLADDDPRIQEMIRAGFFDSTWVDPDAIGENYINAADTGADADGPEGFLAGLVDVARRRAQRRRPTTQDDPEQAFPCSFLEALRSLTHDELEELARLRIQACPLSVKGRGHKTYPQLAVAMKSIIEPHLRSSGWLGLSEEEKQDDAMGVMWKLPREMQELAHPMFRKNEGEYDIALCWALNQQRPARTASMAGSRHE